MSNATKIVRQFHTHFANHDWDKLGELLVDDLSFEGPIDKFSRAADYLEAVKRLEKVCKRVEIKNIISEGDDVCVVWDMVTEIPAIGTARIAEVFHVRGSKIDMVRVFFDARPFAAMFGQ